MFHSIYWFDFFQYEPVKASNNSNHCSNLILYYINNRFNCYCDDLELIWKRKKRRKNGIHAAIDEFLPLVKRISGRHWSTSPGNGALHTLRFSSGHINQTEYSRETRLEQTTDIEPMATNWNGRRVSTESINLSNRHQSVEAQVFEVIRSAKSDYSIIDDC